jgi:hypothetical protein
MNLVCAYCGYPLGEDLVAVPHGEPTPSRVHTWGVFAAALLLPVVGLLAGSACLKDAYAARRAACLLWLIAGLCSSLVYVAVLAG